MRAVVDVWRPDAPRPADADPMLWHMCDEGARQHPQAVRGLWGDDGRLLAVGGVVQVTKGEGYAFYWAPADVTRRVWRKIWSTVFAIVWWAHDNRGLRVVTAVVAADHIEGHRLIRRMGFEPYGPAPAFAGTTVPMLRYLHIWPAIEEPALVRHQRHELWLACLGAWCPAYLQELN